MAEVSFELRKQIRRLEVQLYENRGEWDVCQTCPLQLVCFMKRDPPSRWCAKCDGWVIETVGVVVRCAAFRNKSYTDHKEGVAHICPNCNRFDVRYQTYERIERTIRSVQGDPEYLAKKYGHLYLDFANKKT